MMHWQIELPDGSRRTFYETHEGAMELVERLGAAGVFVTLQPLGYI